ncbi:hypothetical protein Tco_0370550 [Tanacetum coccineum]
MDNPNITMEEYIRLEVEKARRHGKVYNWETARYCRIWYDDDVHNLRSVETEFPAIVFNDELASEEALSCEPTVSPLQDNEINFRISFDEFDDEDYTIYSREVHRVLVLDFESLPAKMAKGLTGRMLIKHRDARGQSVFTSHAWRRLFEVFFNGEVILDIDVADTLQFQLGRVKHRMSWRQVILALGLYTTEEMQTAGFGLYWTESARQIFDKGDLSSSPVALLGRVRKQGAMIFGGQFIARLAKHFGLLNEERLQGLTVIVRDLLVIDMAELARLQICEELVDTWAWVAPGPERQPDVAAGALVDAEGALDIDEARVEEEVHEIRGALGEQREVMDAMARDLSRFTVWATGGISQLLDYVGATYVWYFETHVPYQRCRVRQRTKDASNSAAPLNEDQPDP